MSYEGHIFNTPIGVMVGVGDDEPFTHIIHRSIYEHCSQHKKEWYIAVALGRGKKIVFNNSPAFKSFPASHHIYPGIDFTYWIKVHQDTSAPTIDDIKTHLKF